MQKQQVVQRDGQLAHLGQGGLGQLGHQPVAFGGQFDPDDASVVGVRATPHEAGRLRAVHQPDDAVTLQQEVLGQLADGRRPVAGMALDRDQQLMLDVREADRAGPVFAPALEPAKGDTKREQVLEILPSGLCQ